MNNFETAQRIKDGLPNQIRQNIEEVKIATKKIIKNNSKLGFFKDKDLIDIKDLILKGSIFKNKEIILTDESKKVLDFAINYDDVIMKFAYDNPNLLNSKNEKKLGPIGKLVNFAFSCFIIIIMIFYVYSIWEWIKAFRADHLIESGILIVFFVATPVGVILLVLLAKLFSIPLHVANFFIGSNLAGEIKKLFSKEQKLIDLPDNVFECRIKIFMKFLEETRSFNQFENLLNQNMLNNDDLILKTAHLTNIEKLQLLESILNKQRTCMNHFDMIYFDMEKEKLYKKIYNKEPAENFIYKWIELTKKSWWIGFILGAMSFIGGAALMSAIFGGVCCAAIFGGIRTLFYYLISNRLLNKNIENRTKISQEVQQYLNSKKDDLIRKIQLFY